MDQENGHSYDDSSDTEFKTVKVGIPDNEADSCEEVEVVKYQTRKTEDKDISNEPAQNFRRNDLFKQPFVLKYLQDHIRSLEQTVQDSLTIGEGDESFVDPKCVCRLCTKSDQNIFMRLFFKNHTLTPIAEKLVYLTGREYVEEDLLPQQICLECCESIKSSYTAVTGFLHTYQILSDVVAEIKKKTHVFRKPNTNISLYIQIYDKDYKFYHKQPSIDQERKNNAKKKENALSSNTSVKCYQCNELVLPEAFKEHMAVEHRCNIAYQCTSCDNAFSTLPELTTHPCPADSNEVLGYEGSNFYSNHSDSEMSRTSEHEFTLDKMTYPTTSKRLILERHCHEMVKKGPTDCKSCKYCGRVFRLRFSNDNIKAHILTHLYSSQEKQLPEIDPNNLDLMDHLTLKPSYICSFCSMTKETATALKSHLREYCTTFATKFGFKIRDRKRYGKTRGKLQICKICVDGKAYKSQDFKIHMKENHREHVFFCRICPRFFLGRHEIDYHNRIRHLKQKAPAIKDGNVELKKETLLCEFCSRECKSQQGYRSHVLKVHLNPKPKKKLKPKPKKELKRVVKKPNGDDTTFLECPICKLKQSFKDGKAGLEFHIMKHNAPNGQIICCKREFANFVKYRKHIKSHSRTWSCRLCSVVCESAVLLRDHVAQCHDESKVCKDCSHISKNCYQHMRHMQQVHGPKNRHCSECNIIFTTSKERSIHDSQVHWEKFCANQAVQPDFPEPVLCCGKKFSRRANLKSHTAKHQDTMCKTCGDVLKSKLALLGHNATHHRQKWVECSYCNKSFSNSDNLKYHMLKHTKGRQFECACGLSFYTESDRTKHLRNRKKPCIGSIKRENTTVDVVEVHDENMEVTDDNFE